MKLRFDYIWILTSIVAFSLDFHTGVIVSLATVVILIKDYRIQHLEKGVLDGS